MLKNNKNEKKLSLQAQRIRTLSPAQLKNVAGGDPSPPPTSSTCPTKPKTREL